MSHIAYDRDRAVAYAHKWAHARNPRYYNFGGLGGDCANFVSQCIYEGIGVMNYRPLYGWYYNTPNDRTPSWSGVKYLYDFLVNNKAAGPYAAEAELSDILPGDIIQIATWLPEFHHTLMVVETGGEPTPENILVSTHSYDSDNRPLATYGADRIRYLHILGGRKA